jgi:excinuclease UvrABC ATPase subunit
VIVDQCLGRGSRRSNPATYTGMLDPIRKAFASANGVSPALFSADSDDVCPDCSGLGVVYIGPRPSTSDRAGRDGGRVLFEATPDQLVEHPTSLTGRHLALRASGELQTSGVL